MSKKVKISVLVSGGGTNLQALINSVERGTLSGAEIVLVISSREGAYALERAKQAGIKNAVITNTEELIKALEEARTDLIVLAGYMRILRPDLIKKYSGRIINIHPSLIPKYCGKGFYGERVHRAVLAGGEKVSGATVHFVDEGVDTGEIILQRTVPVVDGDDEKTLAARVLAVEHQILPEAVELIINSKNFRRKYKMRALISVSDKAGVVEFAQELGELGVQIISTGGTLTRLSDNGIEALGISEVTGFPECLDGRVKTLHPAVHGGILAMRGKPEHMAKIKELNIETIDIVAINLYPFKETVMKPGVTLEEAIENIDIGGPAMLRSAAKNHKDVIVICDPADYCAVLDELKSNGAVSYDTKFKLALKVFEHTASYDALIASYLRRFSGAGFPDKLTLTFEKLQTLRYGENPHQQAVYYKEPITSKGCLTSALQIHGKELSFNNINDANGALETLKEFREPTVVAVKHANPCGVGSGFDIFAAYKRAHDCDPTSIYGGIIAANRAIDAQTAEEINKIFVEIVIAPDFTEEALGILKRKQNIRLLKLEGIDEKPEKQLDMKKTSGGILIQDADDKLLDENDLKVLTDRIPTEKEMQDMMFAMKVVKHVKSNAIVIAKDGMTLGIGPGQMNRIWAVKNAVRQSNFELKGAVLASDAFFPFDDCVEAAAGAGITAIIQPGGSASDEDSIKKANEFGMTMIFTGMRHFKH